MSGSNPCNDAELIFVDFHVKIVANVIPDLTMSHSDVLNDVAEVSSSKFAKWALGFAIYEGVFVCNIHLEMSDKVFAKSTFVAQFSIAKVAILGHVFTWKQFNNYYNLK